MANEEAIAYGEEYLKDLITACCHIEEKHKEFVRMAIAALKAEPCEDAVSRSAIMKLQQAYRDECGYIVDNVVSVNLVRNLPSVTPKQRTGKWELTDDEQSYRCSYCKNHWISASEYLDVWKYCPNCGAKMEGGSE